MYRSDPKCSHRFVMLQLPALIGSILCVGSVPYCVEYATDLGWYIGRDIGAFLLFATVMLCVFVDSFQKARGK